MTQKPPTPADTTEIVRRPLDPLRWLVGFHKEIRAALDRLDAVAGDPTAPSAAEEAEALLAFFTGPVAWHDLDEEVSLLPRIRRAALAHGGRVVHVDQCTHDHEQLETLIETTLPQLRRLVDGLGFDQRELSSAAARLRAILEAHLRMEETQLFPLARRLLSQPELKEVLDEFLERDRARRQGVQRAVELAPPQDASLVTELPSHRAPTTMERPPRPERTEVDWPGPSVESDGPLPEASGG